MPLYFFHFLHHHERIEDELGVECPDLNAAKEAAVHSVQDLVGEEVRFGDTVDTGLKVEIANSEGHVLSLISFTDTIRWNGKG